MKKFLKWILSGLYGLVMIEVVIMISPFAFYWYSLYAPMLQILHRSNATAWMEAFFLPHSVITTSPALEFLRWGIGPWALSLGLIGFFLCAAQVYGSKLLRRGVVNSWIYSRLRHPQYLCLAIAGLGLLTVWPRIIILILYLVMLFIYYFLARFEERQVESKHPDYAQYRKRTAMFIPGNPGGRLFNLLFGWIPSRRAALAISSLVIIAVVIGGGVLLRRYTIGHSATDLLPEDRVMAIAIWPMPPDKLQQVVAAAMNDPRVKSALEHEPGAVFTAHVLPENYGMVDMFADPGTNHAMFSRISPGRFKFLLTFIVPYIRGGLRGRIMGSPEDNYKVVFSRVDEPGHPTLTVNQITDLSAKMTPVAITDVAGSGPLVKDVTIPPRRSFWGDITMPMF